MTGVDKVLAHRVVLIVGEEEERRRQALDELLKAAGLAKDDFDLESLDADSSDPGAWIASAGTAPFLAERRTTVVRHILRICAEKLEGIDLNRLPESSLLILVGDEESGSEDKIQRMKTTVRKGWEKTISAAGGYVWAFDPDPKRARQELKNELQERGARLTEKAVDTLLEMSGGNLSRALGEIEKLVLFVGPDRAVGENDVRELVIPSREWNVFEMVNAIVGGNVGEALRHLRVIVANNQKAEEAGLRSILPMVSRQLRLLWQARLCVDARCDPANPTSEVERMLPDKPNIAKEPPYRQAALTRTASKLSQPRLVKCFAIVADTDARLKGALPSFSGIETLERMILEMANAMSAKPA